MTTIEQELLQALLDLESAAKSLRTANPKPDLGELMARIDSLQAQLPPDTDSNLLHYLHRKSHEKARMWLEGRRSVISSGVCGR